MTPNNLCGFKKNKSKLRKKRNLQKKHIYLREKRQRRNKLLFFTCQHVKMCNVKQQKDVEEGVPAEIKARS